MVGIMNRLFGYFTANDMRLTTLRPVPYAQSGLRGLACIASVSREFVENVGTRAKEEEPLHLLLPL